MSNRSQDVKRQLFRGLSSRKSSTLDSATQNLLARTLRKQSDKYKSGSDNTAIKEEGEQFIIHKSTSPEDYKIFSTQHPIRESRLQAFEQSEQAFEELFHRNGFFDDSGSEDEEPDLSAFVPPNEVIEDDILISVPGYSKEEITASKRLNINDRKNVRLSRVSELERAFPEKSFLKTLSSERLQEYGEINREFKMALESAMEQRRQVEIQTNGIPKSLDELPPEHRAEYGAYELENIRDAVAELERTAWMYSKR